MFRDEFAYTPSCQHGQRVDGPSPLRQRNWSLVAGLANSVRGLAHPLWFRRGSVTSSTIYQAEPSGAKIAQAYRSRRQGAHLPKIVSIRQPNIQLAPNNAYQFEVKLLHFARIFRISSHLPPTQPFSGCVTTISL